MGDLFNEFYQTGSRHVPIGDVLRETRFIRDRMGLAIGYDCSMTDSVGQLPVVFTG